MGLVLAASVSRPRRPLHRRADQHGNPARDPGLSCRTDRARPSRAMGYGAELGQGGHGLCRQLVPHRLVPAKIRG